MNSIYHSDKGYDINPRTRSQESLAQTVENNTVVFATGPAGTGKTFVSMALALSALKNGKTDELLLTRPAVQAGEDLGFLPGELDEKLAPYVRPFDNILSQLCTPKRQHNLKNGNKGINYEPLGFLRGQTLDNCWTILDEAQNATRDQMRMFLTRLGPDAKAIVTGDPKQTDLSNPRNSALHDAKGLLSGINDISFVRFGEDEIVRHDVVRSVIKAYRSDSVRKTERRRRSGSEEDAGESSIEPSSNLEEITPGRHDQ
jgi:phosphate starvation-inducible PhoH-like protein